MRISVDHSPPVDATSSSNDTYSLRAASGPVVVNCTATGPEAEMVSYQWSSTCRKCVFQSKMGGSITRPAVHSGDNGTHTCMATGNGISATASIDFFIVGK